MKGIKLKNTHERNLFLIRNEDLAEMDMEYALVHLFEKYPEYFNFFKKKLYQGKEVILDNSLYELGKSFNPHKYIYWVNKLNPTYYVIPDVFNDGKETVELCVNWVNFFEPEIQVGTKSIVVVHGKDLNELVNCYIEISMINPDMIAFNFADQVYKKYSRLEVLEHFDKSGIINENADHHLLGLYEKDELSQYKKFHWVKSIDTSNPVCNAYENRKIDYNKEITKPKTTIIDIFEKDFSDKQIKLMKNNIKSFKSVL